MDDSSLSTTTSLINPDSNCDSWEPNFLVPSGRSYCESGTTFSTFGFASFLLIVINTVINVVALNNNNNNNDNNNNNNLNFNDN